MADVTTSLLQLVLQETGNNPNNWGELLNDTLQRIEDAIASTNATSTTGGNTTLTDDQALKPIQLVSGVLVSNALIKVPDHTRPYIFRNATSGAFTVTLQRASGGGSVVVPQGKAVSLYCDGTDVNSAADVLDGSIDTLALAALAVTTAKIADSNVTTAKIADANVTTPKIADANVTNAKLAFDTGPLCGFRNRIINGDFRLDQRNGGGSVSVGAGTTVYTSDRWLVSATGAGITYARVAGSSGSPFRARLTGAASVTGVGLIQRIERLNSADLAGGVATLSVKASSSSLTTLTWTIYQATTNDNFGALTQLATGNFTINSTEATYVAANITIPNGATTGLQVTLSGGALLSGQTLTIGDVQLEAGASAQPFERRPYNVELMLCQRYFSKGFPPDTVPGGSVTTIAAIANSGGTVYTSILFPVPMRVAPTVTAYNPTLGTTGTWRDGGGADPAVSTSPTAVGCVFTVTGATLSATISGSWTASAEL